MHSDYWKNLVFMRAWDQIGRVSANLRINFLGSLLVPTADLMAWSHPFHKITAEWQIYFAKSVLADALRSPRSLVRVDLSSESDKDLEFIHHEN